MRCVITPGVLKLYLYAGILGENLIIPTGITQSVFQFAMVNFVTLAVCIACVAAIILYVKAKRLM